MRERGYEKRFIAYTISMEEITVTERATNDKNVGYLLATLASAADDLGGKIFRHADDARSVLTIRVPEEGADYLRSETEDRIADVIAVRYKYDFFRSRIRPDGIEGLKRELLFSALIAADLAEDKRYIMRKLRLFREYAIDGIWNFRLGALKRKWTDIVGYIPAYFDEKRLKDFIVYLVGEKRGRKVVVENGNVYDKNFNLLRRSDLIDATGEGKLVREVILSGGGSVELIGNVPSLDEKYLREYFGSSVVISASRRQT